MGLFANLMNRHTETILKSPRAAFRSPRKTSCFQQAVCRPAERQKHAPTRLHSGGENAARRIGTPARDDKTERAKTTKF